jgi:hypothetical protein
MPSPLINTVVRPWWSTYGWNLTDATTFRHMIRMTKDELVHVRVLIQTYQELGDHELALEMLEDAARAEEMVADMADRLSTILSLPPKKLER